MKKLYTIFILLASIFVFSQETYEITFEKKYNLNDEDTQQTYAGKLEKIKNSPDYYVLKVNSDYSIFLPTAVNASTLEYVFKDFKTGFTYKKYSDEEKISEEKWGRCIFKELPETKVILGYTCKSADIGSGIIAYYTEEIPVPGSPLTYGAMPGIMLGVDFGGYTAFATSIKKTNEKLDISKYRKQ